MLYTFLPNSYINLVIIRQFSSFLIISCFSLYLLIFLSSRFLSFLMVSYFFFLFLTSAFIYYIIYGTDTHTRSQDIIILYAREQSWTDTTDTKRLTSCHQSRIIYIIASTQRTQSRYIIYNRPLPPIVLPHRPHQEYII